MSFRCGTIFNNSLTSLEKETLTALRILARRLEKQAYDLNCAVDYCERNLTTKGLDEMVAMSFNANQFTPSYGGGGSSLPPGQYKGVIVDTRGEDSLKDGVVKGGYLALDLTPIEGPLANQKHTDRLNLHHMNPQVVEIANKQLSAYCHVTGVFAFEDTQQLCNKPFLFEIGFQKGHEPTAEKPQGGYTEVKRILDLNQNEPGKGAAGGGGAQSEAAKPPEEKPAEAAAGEGGGGWGAGGGAATTGGGAGASGGGWGGAGASGGGAAGWGAK